jgi:D-alanyl-D-alanine carboxypeptidase/D-alanyl-D-alanine-endopeptidase (penicillin-binding protein 4)
MKNIFLGISFIICFVAHAQLTKTLEEIERLKIDKDLSNASWGGCIIDNTDGSLLLDKDKDKSLIPASSTKTITTATALALLGEDYKYTTQVYYSGTISDSILAGDIIIKGSGDPTLASLKMENTIDDAQFFNTIILALKKLSIKKIEGRIICDASCFKELPIPSTWNWSDIGNHFGSGSFGINFSDNEFVLKCNPTKPSKAPEIELNPAIPSLILHNNFVCSEATYDGDDAYIYGAPYSNHRFLVGPVPLASAIKVKGSLPDAPMYLAQLLTEKIALSGISITKYPTTDRILDEDRDILPSNNLQNITSFSSPSLKEIIKATNQKSLNLYAETILKTIAKEKSSSASTENGLKIINDYWSQKGVNLTGFYMNDGSGLSRHNAISPYHFTQIMFAISKENYYTTFKNSLAIAGVSGTLKSLCVGTDASGRIIAKSGTLERGISYTGYVKSSSGKILSFSMIFNNYNCTNTILRKKIEQLMIYMSKI